MESIENGSYENQIEIRSPIKKYYTTHQIFTILQDIVCILDFAARNKIFHADLKPANILIKPDGKPTIADFGVSFRMTGEAGASNIIGTPNFLSYTIHSAWKVALSTRKTPDFKHDPEKSDVMSLAITAIDM